MPQAVADPGEIRRFAQTLKGFNNELEGRMGALHGQLLSLGQSWRDREHQKFAEEFTETLKAIHRFVEASNQHIPFLMKKAEHLEQYLNQR
ncbi:MAG: WXG100 family type VII secretion target [Isosphaeraceae bacterium]